MKTTSELRNLSISELNDELIALRRKQFQLRFKQADAALEQTHQFALVRKTIARIKTLLTEKGKVK